MTLLRSSLAVAAALALLAGCAIEVQNRQPAQELAQAAKPPGSVYTGWRVFQERCASCHGEAATGSSQAPDLLMRLRTLGPRGFMSRVLYRYDWGLRDVPPEGESPARDALVDDILQRRQGALVMPAWQGEPRVQAHIADLYAWLSARADGTQGPGRPAP